MKTKFLLPLFLFVAFANIVSAQPGRGFGRDYLFDKLDLTEEQESKLDNLRDKHQKDMIDMKADLEKARLDLKNLTKDGSFARADFLTAHKKVQSIKNKIGDSWANHRMDMLDVLSKEQREKIADIKDDFRDDCRGMKRNHMRNKMFQHRGHFMPW